MTVLCAFIVIAPALFSHSLPTYSEIVGSSAESEDERAVDEQEKFERKYNFRFEEPDSEFVSFILVHSTCNMYMHFPYNLWYTLKYISYLYSALLADCYVPSYY